MEWNSKNLKPRHFVSVKATKLPDEWTKKHYKQARQKKTLAWGKVIALDWKEEFVTF